MKILIQLFMSGTQTHRFSAASAGCRLMHYLAAKLFAADVPVAVTELCHYDPLVPVQGRAEPDDIVIYPECIHGNPLGARRIVRYFGYFPSGFYAGQRVKSDECCLLFDEDYLEEANACCDHPVVKEDVFMLPTIDPTWVYDAKKTNKNLVFRSYHPKKICPVPPNLGESYLEVPPKEQALFMGQQCVDHWGVHFRTLSFLRRSENVYSCDSHTMLNNEAALSGCNLFIVKSATEWVKVENAWEKAQRHLMHPHLDCVMAVALADRIKKFFNV